jgi:fructose-1,6-bisphosphatase/inositol monophosphatase family enzyme
VIDDVGALLRDVARQVVLPRFRHLAPGEVTEKEPGELVTVADSEAEALLVTGLTGLLPGSRVVGEEGVSADPAQLDLLAGDGPVWLVDPVDGTGNFAAGRTPFAMMVALRRGGRTVAGWILDPVGDSLIAAEDGAGAYLDGVRVSTRGDGPAADALRGMLVTRYLPDELRADLAARPRDFGAVLPGRHCAGAEYPAVVDGRQDFALFWRTMPWDHAPGALILTEAGGVARHPDGTAYTPDSRRPGLLIAANADIWHTVRETVFPA